MRVRHATETLLLRKPVEHRHGTGQNGLHLNRQRLPGKALAFVHVQLSLPIEHLAEVQPHQSVRIVHAFDPPGVDFADGDAYFLEPVRAAAPALSFRPARPCRRETPSSLRTPCPAGGKSAGKRRWRGQERPPPPRPPCDPVRLRVAGRHAQRERSPPRLRLQFFMPDVDRRNRGRTGRPHDRCAIPAQEPRPAPRAVPLR